MNENLQSALANILNDAASGVDQSVAFMQSELPEFAEQLLTWYAIKELILCAIGAVLLFALFKIDQRVYRYVKTESDLDDDDVVVCYYGFGTLARVVYLFPACMINIEWLKIIIAPKVWMIEYASNILK